MKIRNGWVSNSSTCSFMLIGWKVDDDDLLETLEESFDVVTDDGPAFVGLTLSYGESIDSVAINMEEFMGWIEKTEKRRKGLSNLER
jgi:hypothetical protein